MEEKSAWDLGYDAYWADKNKDDNPYMEDTDDYNDWQQGWEEAELECEYAPSAIDD